MPYSIDLTNVSPKNIYLLEGFSDTDPNGKSVSFTNYYMELNGKPFFGVSGELHFSRLWEERWEDAIIKCKSGGVNTIATYVFWNHHEEIEGEFDFTGRRNLRRFIELCGKHGLYVIVRIGPFDHGEVRNGGLPDWLYGKPFEVRSLNEGFLNCTRRLYRAIAKQLKDLYFKDGGPIIAAQMDNEYMHSAAPWEITTGVSEEWIPAGSDGDKYMLKLRDIAREEGIDVPFYTCTGWGGAATPKELMPLWGGYAFRPWIFYSHKGEHPATEEYIYRDNHNNSVPSTYNFEPFYQPESKPYLCCEMGGGMTCSYYYRFVIPFESIDAMANIKLGSGCNMLGYYMYHGGTNLKGKLTPFLNESQTPKLSYDYQAALGEFGQVRESYKRLKTLHLLTKTFAEIICRSKTVLPEGSQDIYPEDADTLRFAVRVCEDGSGFLFINNYQDHAITKDKENEQIILKLPNETLEIGGISLKAGENCVLPFNISIGNLKLKYSTAQPMSIIDVGNDIYAFFSAPEGMAPRYEFQDDIVHVDMSSIDMPTFSKAQDGKNVHFITLSRSDSRNFYMLEHGNKQIALITEGVLLPSHDSIKLEHDCERVTVSVFPQDAFVPENAECIGKYGIFTKYELSREPVTVVPEIEQVGKTRYSVNLPKWNKSDVKEIILQLYYSGDVAEAFINGDMISDNFCNDEVWEIGLKEFEERLEAHPITIRITPIKEGANVNVESVMAGRKEELDRISGGLKRVAAKTIYEWKL